MNAHPYELKFRLYCKISLASLLPALKHPGGMTSEGMGYSNALISPLVIGGMNRQCMWTPSETNADKKHPLRTSKLNLFKQIYTIKNILFKKFINFYQAS